MKLSPAQRRKAAIGEAFQPWYLTDGMTSAAAHITAGFRAIRELTDLRKEAAQSPKIRRKLKLYTLSAIRSARFNLAIGRRNSPLPCIALAVMVATMAAPALAADLSGQFRDVCKSPAIKSDKLEAACAANDMPDALKSGERFKAVGIGAEVNALAANLAFFTR